MDQGKHDKQQKQSDQRQMNQERNRDMGNQRNEEETGKPVQLDKDGKEQQGGQHQGGQVPKPDAQRKPDQQGTGQRNA
jgi:hypothetical protein